MNQYQQRISAAEKAGFKIYLDTTNAYGSPGTILCNTETGNPYDGECVDIFEDGTFEQYTQFPGQKPVYKVL